MATYDATTALVVVDMQNESVYPKRGNLAIIERLYVATLSRKPTPAEVETFKPIVASPADLKKNLDDLFWALLNSREFIFNH